MEDSNDFLLFPTQSNDIFSDLSNAINTKLPKYVELSNILKNEKVK
jgi:hypothetical protein